MKIAVGTENNAKIKAVELCFEKLNVSDYSLMCKTVDSGVSDMPKSDEEMVLGAKNRAKNVYNHFSEINPNIDYAVGIEGGITKLDTKYFVKGWVSVFNGKKFSLASGLALPFPDEIGKLIYLKDIELGPLMDKLTGEHKLNTRGGSVGVMTKNKILRYEVFRDALVASFMEFMNCEFYEIFPLKCRELYRGEFL
jgi:inosine/xanthosine triphosphatase